MPTVQHDDFGEKIGGAKKDLWKERGLVAGDLDGMNEREADKFVKKDNVWKKPDYGALIADGVPLEAAYYVKTVRDSLAASPVYLRADDTPEKRNARQRQYIDTVICFKDAAEAVRSREDVFALFDKTLVASGFVERDPGYGGWRTGINGRGNPLITDKLFRAVRISSEHDYQRKLTIKAARDQFGVPKEQKVPKGFEIRRRQNGDGEPDTYYVVKGRIIVQDGIENRDAALTWAREAASSSRVGKKRFIPEQLEHIERTGPDYRSGHSAKGDDFINTFGFRGGEFGNWMTRADRQASLDMGFDALKDLAAALKISDADISFGGALAIAFGARGSGSAVAHYEPMRKVINLTKMRGAGSLAHEWWHAFDDHLGEKMGTKDYLTNDPRLYAPFAKLIDAMKYKWETPEQAETRAFNEDIKLAKQAAACIDHVVLYPMRNAGNKDAEAAYEDIKSSFLAGEPEAITRLSELKKSVTDHSIPKDSAMVMERYQTRIREALERTEATPIKVKTDFYAASQKMASSFEKDGGYWDSNTEMSARAFACYIMDRLPGRSDYLAGHAESAVNIVPGKDGEPEIICAFPKGEERAAINAAFDETFADLKKEHRLTNEDTALSVIGMLKEAQLKSTATNTIYAPAKPRQIRMEI